MSLRWNVLTDSRRPVLVTGLLLALATAIAYSNSFQGPFVFDDLPSIAWNTTIRQLWPPWAVLNPPAGETVGGRPLVNISLALNYALSGTAVWSYHLVNLFIHVLTGLALFDVLRRTFVRTQTATLSLTLAAVTTLVWLLHPLQTEAVTYIVQRAESMVSLCYLITLYCVIRGAETGASRRWYLLAVLACFAGVSSKEVMVSAPLVILLYDRTFLSGTFRAAWRARWPLYLGLLSSWVLLGWFVMTTGRGETAGFGTYISAWSYALTQSRAVVRYLTLAMWPHPLVFDYGFGVETSLVAVAGYLLVVLGLLGFTLLALWRWPALGFIGVAFFAVIAPSSSVVPIATQTVAEHRMYLPLAMVITMVVLGLHRLLGRRTLPICLAWALALGIMTSMRNRDYFTELALWQDTVTKWPTNPRARHYLGLALENLGRSEEALARFREAVRLEPDYAGAQNDLGRALAERNRLEEASAHFTKALQSNPNFLEARYNNGNVLVGLGRLSEGAQQFEKVLESEPEFSDAYASLGDALLRMGRLPEAEEEYVDAVRFNPESAELHMTLGTILSQLQRPMEASRQFEKALAINPEFAPAHNALGQALAKISRVDEAIAHFEEALRIDPSLAEAQANLGIAQELRRQVNPGQQFERFRF